MPAAPDTVKSIFFAALELGAVERETFLTSACQGDGELRRRVEELLHAAEATDPLLDRPAAWHLNLPSRGQDTPVSHNPEQRASPEITQAGRFRLLGEIARGGMGAVLRAHDPELARDLAIKVVLPQHRDHPALLQRFLGEARLAGQLQHPGITPVYDVGRLTDGRPFFAMKLIEGRTLAQLLRERPNPGHDLPRFLRYFEAACQAVGYAHAQKVIHRDLKPSNVMVGAFGEVQVMDWGLAKVLPSGGCQPPVSEDDDTGGLHPPLGNATQAGRILGTPGYMSPEQARGEALSERSDVYSLGAMLCEILTGAPPFTGDETQDPLEVLSLTRQADLTNALTRLDGCGADVELVGLARNCLSPQPEARPVDGVAVAERVAAYLAGLQDRLRQAELGKARAEVRAEGERTRRRLAVGLAAAVLAVVVLGTGTAFLAQRRLAEQERRQQAGEVALARAADLRKQSRWAESLAVLEQARQRLEASDEDLAQQINAAVAELELIGRLEAIRLRSAIWTGRGFASAQADREYESEFRAVGLGSPDEAVATVADRVRISGARAALVAALDDWAFRTVNRGRREWARAVAGDADDSDWGKRIRSEWNNPKALRQLAREAPMDRLSPHLLSTLGQELAGTEGTAFLRRAQLLHPGDFWLNFHLGRHLTDERQFAEAESFYRAALAARAGTGAVLVNLGVVLNAQGKRQEACDCYRRAIALDDRLAEAHSNLGAALNEQDDLSGAEACFRKTIASEPDFPTGHLNLGIVQRRQGKFADAHASLRKALELGSQGGEVWVQLGRVYLEEGNPAEAIKCCRKAVESAPGEGEWHYHLGVFLAAQGKSLEAMTCYRKAIELDPRHALAHVNLGMLQLGQGKRAEAIMSFRQALTNNPRVPEAYTQLGKTLSAQGQLDEAIIHFRKVVELFPHDASGPYNLGTALFAQQNWDQAVECFHKAIALKPNMAEAHCNLGLALLGRGDFTDALAPLHRGHTLGRTRKDWSYPSDQWLQKCERLIEQEKALLDVLAGKSKASSGAECIRLAILCYQTRRYVAATRMWTEAFERDRRLADDLKTAHRCQAATTAIMAATTKGRDTDALNESQKANLRKQALQWLKADLAARAGQPAAERAAMLQNWQAESVLATVRDEDSLQGLPAAERIAWREFWSEVRNQQSGRENR